MYKDGQVYVKSDWGNYGPIPYEEYFSSLYQPQTRYGIEYSPQEYSNSAYDYNKGTYKGQTGRDADADLNAYNAWYQKMIGPNPLLPGTMTEGVWIKDPSAGGRIPGFADKRDQYINSQKSQAFNNFLKVAVPAAIGFGGLALGPALSGVGATGAGAGSAASSGGLGSFLGDFSTNAALGGALQGGVGGYLSGGSLSDALKGAALGGVTGGYGGAAANALGLQGAGSAAFQGALKGASGGLATGDLKAAGLGAALSGGAGYIGAGGHVPGLGSIPGASLDQTTGIAGMQGPTQGAGILGAGARAVSGLTGGGGSTFTGGSMFGNLGSALKVGSSLYGDYSNRKTNKEIEKRLLESRDQALGQLQPYQQMGLDAQRQLSDALAAGFNPADLENDPGYQFQLQQGEKSLGRALSAQGMSQSGAALKAAQEYGQNLASTTYNDAYNRWLQQNQQLAGLGNTGYSAAQGAGSIYANMGDLQGQMLNANQRSRNELYASLASALGGFL